MCRERLLIVVSERKKYLNYQKGPAKVRKERHIEVISFRRPVDKLSPREEMVGGSLSLRAVEVIGSELFVLSRRNCWN